MDGQRRAQEAYDRMLAAYQESDDPNRLQQYRRKAKTNARRAARLLADLERAAAAFGLDPDGMAFGASRMAVDALKADADAKAFAYAELAGQVGGTDVGKAAMADGVPAYALADFAEERGADTSAVRGLFQEAQAIS